MRISDVSALRGPLLELNNQLFGDNGAERLEALNLWLKGVTKQLLKRVGEIAFPGVARFESAKNFTKSNDKVKFWNLGENFLKRFGTKIEQNIATGILLVDQLLESSRDPEIMVALGVKGRIITLAEFYAALEAQGHGQKEGLLRVDGSWNIAYIQDIDGIVWAVDAYWYAGSGWYVDAYSVDDPDPWYAGRRVLSRKSA